MAKGATITESAIPRLIGELAPIFGKHVVIDIVPRGETRKEGSEDFRVHVKWLGLTFDFAAEAKGQNTTRAIEDSLHQSRRWAAATGLMPMIIVPYLSENRIDRLLDEGVSGLDLCGNGLVVAPERLLLLSTGRPNRYPDSRPTRFAYRGTTSLVPRVFLRRKIFHTVGQIKDEIDAAGGLVALSTVSKALARMADDLIVDRPGQRTGQRIVLLQPDKLMDELQKSFEFPKTQRFMRAKLSVPLAEVFRRAASSEPRVGLRLVLSGASSLDRYAAGLRADDPTVYCDDLDELCRRVGDAWQPTERFADITVVETHDPTPYFDSRRDDSGITYASPVQTFLELAAVGEKRDREIARDVRSRILFTLGF